MSNLGPLTTTFTAPSDCSLLSVEIDGPSSTSYYNYVGQVWPSPLRCFPSGYPNALANRFSDYYSPGICPSAWTAYLTSDFPDPAETTALCCPPGFIVVGDTTNLFASSFPCFTTHETTAPVTALVISGSIDINTAPYGNNPSGLITSTAFAQSEIGWSVFGVQVRYHTTDFLSHNSSTSTITTNSTGSAQTTTNLATSITSPALTQTIPTTASFTVTATTATAAAIISSNDNNTLSTGAKIGIGIGVPLAVIILCIILAFLLIRRRRAAARNTLPTLPTTLPESPTTEFKAELPGNKPGTPGAGSYAGKAELAVTVKPSELEATPTTTSAAVVPHEEAEVADWPLPRQRGPTAEDEGDTLNLSRQGTLHSNVPVSGTVSPPETAPSQSAEYWDEHGDRTTEEAGAEPYENVKYRGIDEEPKVKKQRSRGEF